MAEAAEPNATTPSLYVLRAARLLIFVWWLAAFGAAFFLAGTFGFHRVSIECALAAGLAALLAVPLFRHIGVAAIAALTPFSGIAVAGAMNSFLHLAQVPANAFMPLGIAVSFLATDAFLARIRTEPARWDIATLIALGRASRPAALGVLLSVAFALVPFISGRLRPDLVPAGAMLQLMIVMLCAAVIVPLSMSWLPFNEYFLTRSNRTNEIHQALSFRLSFVTETRWSLSLTGVWFVLATLVAFELQPLTFDWKLVILCPAWMFIVANPCVRRWRVSLAFALTLTLALLFGLWTRPLSGSVSPHELATAGAVLAAGFAFAVAIARRGRLQSGASEEDEATARLQAIQETSGVVVYGTLAAVGSQLPFIGAPRAVMAITILVASEIVVLLFGPAMATAFYWLLPRRRSLEEVFDRR